MYIGILFPRYAVFDQETGDDGAAVTDERSDREDWEDVLDDQDAPLYTVGVVADLMGVDPQVVRGYDKRGIVSPERADSGHRRYSRRDIGRLSRAMELSDEGIPTVGIERILELEDRLADHRSIPGDVEQDPVE